MPFNGSGQFNRLYNWQNDAANGLDILAPRMDGEDDGFAEGLSNCITRDGQSPPTAAINWGGQDLLNVGTITVATLNITGNEAVAGNVNAANGIFTGAISAAGGITSLGDLVVSGGDIVAYRTGGTQGTIYLSQDKSKYLYNDGTNYNFVAQGLTVGGTIQAAGALSAAGVNSAGNANVTGTLSVATTGSRASIVISDGVTGGLQFFDGANSKYLRIGANQLQLINSAYSGAIWTVDDAGNMVLTGQITRVGQGQFPFDGMNRTSVRITDGTAAPSGGLDGDIYFQYS